MAEGSTAPLAAPCVNPRQAAPLGGPFGRRARSRTKSTKAIGWRKGSRRIGLVAEPWGGRVPDERLGTAPASPRRRGFNPAEGGSGWSLVSAWRRRQGVSGGGVCGRAASPGAAGLEPAFRGDGGSWGDGAWRAPRRTSRGTSRPG